MGFLEFSSPDCGYIYVLLSLFVRYNHESHAMDEKMFND